MKLPVLLNKNNYIGNSQFQYNFPSPLDIKHGKIALRSINMYYSWFNITEEFNNYQYSIQFQQGSSYPAFSVVMPYGQYSIENIQEYLVIFCIENGLALVNDLQQVVVYIEFVVNPNTYKVQLNLFQPPTSLPSGWSNPYGFIFPDTIGFLPRVTIGDSNNFGLLIGFNTGTYQNASQLGQNTPVISPVSAVYIQCNNLLNRASNPQTNLDFFSQGNVAFGDMIQYEPRFPLFVKISDGQIQKLTITLLDQNYNRLAINDSDVNIELIIKTDE